MKKIFVFMLALMLSGATFAQKGNPFVGVWQKAYVDQGSVTFGTDGKVFLPDGRVFGYNLNPADFENYEKFDFIPWMFADYNVSSDSTYTEKVTLHNDKGWETTINFTYRFLNSRTLYAYYEHINPDGSARMIEDLWIKAVYDPKQLKGILKKVSDNWDEYVKQAKQRYGRE